MTSKWHSNDILLRKDTPSSKGRLIFILAALVWTVVVLILLLWSLDQVDQRVFNSALVHAKSTIEQDIRYRRWNAQLKGVYGEVSDILKPNKYLKIPDRDIVTPSGKILTKVNPAYMTRQVHALGATESGVIGHITSLNPIRPENKADAWEAEALKAMRTAPSLKSTIEEIGEASYLRVMLPLITEKGCLTCHAEQGYKVGDIRGGISGSVPLAPLFKNVWRERLGWSSAFGLAWLLGCATILGIYRIKKTEVSLRKSEAKYRVLVETMSEGTIILDNQGKIVFASTPMANMLGRSPTDLENSNFREFISQKNRSDFNQRLESCTDGNTASYEVELVKSDSSPITTLFSPQVLRHGNEECIGLLVVVTDITNLKNLEKELRRNQRLSSLGLLAGGIAHEVNTPVQYLKTNTSFIQNAFEYVDSTIRILKRMMPRIQQDSKFQSEATALQENLDQLSTDGLLEEVSDALDENMEGIKRISDIVSSVKGLAGNSPAYPEVVNPNSLIEKSIDLTRNSWEPVAKMDLRLTPNLQHIKCIPKDIIQVVVALITNASDAISEKTASIDGAGMGRISIDTQVKDRNLTIKIADNGAGISDDNINKIFEPFYTTKAPGKGVGQGLAIAYRLIEDHNGVLSVESEQGIGTEFTVKIPV